MLCTSPEVPAGPATVIEKIDLPFGGANGRHNMIAQNDPIPSGIPFTRYRIRLHDGHECFVYSKDLRRDRRSFNKLVLRNFLKHSVSREPIRGAPWQLQPELCHEFGLDTELPPLFTNWLERARKVSQEAFLRANKENSFNQFALSQKDPLAIRPMRPKGARPPFHNVPPHNMQQQSITNYFGQDGQAMLHGSLPVHTLGPQQGDGQLQGIMQFANQGLPQHASYQGQAIQSRVVISQNQRKNAKHDRKAQQAQAIVAPRVPSPPPIKYPIEDLDYCSPPKADGSYPQRPPLKSYTEKVPGLEDAKMTSLLDCWVALNVQHDFFLLDTFTVDDFAEAMSMDILDKDCELIAEIHCAVLKRLVDTDGDILTRGMDSDEEESDSEPDEESSPSREPTPPPARSTRSSLAKQQADQLRRSPTPKVTHRAREMLADFDWIQHLKDRNFGDGKWVLAMIGFLRHASIHAPYLHDQCFKALAHLAPSEMEADPQTAIEQYDTMDVNLRLEILEILLGSVFTTKDFQEHLKACAVRQTEIRREVNEKKREKNALCVNSLPKRSRKVLTLYRVEEMVKLDNERKIMAPEYLKDNPEEVDVSLPNVEKPTNENSEEELDEERVYSVRGLRNAGRRKEDRRRKEEEQRNKEAAKKARKRQLNPYEQILEKIENLKSEIKDYEEQIFDSMQQIKELNVTRIEPLGTDRWANSYFFYERNGMPLGGEDEGHAEYLSGRLWIQGPLSSIHDSNVNLDDKKLADHKQIFGGITPLERKNRDEGETSLTSMMQWGFYDTPAEIDQLIIYLDEHGVREMKLKRVLENFKASITDCMARMHSYFQELEDEKRAKSEEAQERSYSTRKRTFDESEIMDKYPCLKWTNSRAVRELGHLHSQEPQRKRKQQRKLQEKAKVAAEVADAPQQSSTAQHKKVKREKKDEVLHEPTKVEKRETRSRGKK